eukprot:3507540-Pyramimonas_sp.AAC.1
MLHAQLPATALQRGQAIGRVGNREVAAQCPDLRHSHYIEVLMVRELGSDNTALRTVLTFIASLPAGGPAMTFGNLPTKQGYLRMTTSSKLSPRVHLALQHVMRNYIRIASVVTVRLAKSIHRLPAVTHADSCALVYYDKDVTPGFHCCESNGAALDVRATDHWVCAWTGDAVSEII